MIEVTLLTQAACAFCDDAKTILSRLAGEYPLHVRELDLTSDEGRTLGEQTGVLFPPGILFNGEAVAYGRPSERRLRRDVRRRLERQRR